MQPAGAANDDGGDAGDDATVDAAGKPAARPASAGQAQPAFSAANDDAAAAQSPAAAAQAAIRGAGDNGNSGNGSDKNSGSPEKTAPAKTADSNNAPQVQPEQPGPTAQPAAPQSPTTMTAMGAPATANGMPVQTTGAAHNVAASVQVAPQSSATPNLNNLAVEIAARSQSGAKQFQIRLDPPELGRVDVRLSIDATGKTEAHVTADHPETLSLLQKDSSTLTQALRDSGLDVSQRGLNFSLRGQNSQGGNDNGGQGRGPRSNLAAMRAFWTRCRAPPAFPSPAARIRRAWIFTSKGSSP